MRSTTRFIAACWLASASPAGAAAPAAEDGRAPLPPASVACLACHPSAGGVLSGPMATRAAEKRFARRAFGADGDRFFAQSCTGCHVAGCDDCHGGAPHAGAPAEERRLHPVPQGLLRRLGLPRPRAPRGPRPLPAGPGGRRRALPEDAPRRARRARDDLRRLPHHALAPGGQEGREDLPGVPPRGVARRAGARVPRPPREDGVRGLPRGLGPAGVRDVPRPRDDPRAGGGFSPLRAWGPWRKSAYLKSQGAPPLGLNERGKVAPIRPQFVLLATDTSRGWENRLLAAEWKAFSPHTTRRGTVTCSECHDSPRRFLLEKDAERLYELEKDGLPLRSFWSREKQTVVNGSFLPGGPPRGDEPQDAGVRPAVPEAMAEAPRSRRAALQALILSLAGRGGSLAVPDPPRGGGGLRPRSGVGARGGRPAGGGARPAAAARGGVREGGDFLAFDLTCTHLGCTVKATEQGFSCPCHGSRFGRGGDVLKGPAPRALRRLGLDRRDGIIRVSRG